MKRSVRCAEVGLVLSALVVSASPGHADSSSNGVYGGYVGSGQWFNSMRQGAADRAMIQSLGEHKGDGGTAKTPAGYLDYIVILRFPGGNPFPNGKIPEVRIVARNQQADPVLRSPYVEKGGVFHTSLKKGELYEVYWFYPFGGKERFATIIAGPSGPLKRRIVLDYVPGSSSGKNREGSSVTPPGKDPSSGNGENYRPLQVKKQQNSPTASDASGSAGNAASRSGVQSWDPPKTRKWESPSVDGGYHPPQSDDSYRPPQSDDSYRPPQSDNSYRPPRSSNDYHPPQSDGDYHRPEAGPGYQEPATR